MESATIAANGFRFRVPYGTLLCVSDKPVHGELKLKVQRAESGHAGFSRRGDLASVDAGAPVTVLGVVLMACAPPPQGMANEFYRQRVHEHLRIGLEAVRLLRELGVNRLQSRKLRGFDEPPFR